MSTYFLIGYGLVNYRHLKLDHPVEMLKKIFNWVFEFLIEIVFQFFFSTLMQINYSKTKIIPT